MEAHDDILETGSYIADQISVGRTFSIPIDSKLQKKSKYKNLIKSHKSNEDFETLYKAKHFKHLFQSNVTVWKKSDGYNLRDNFHSLCRDGESKWRSPYTNRHLNCRFLTHHDSYLKLGPFPIEEKNFHPGVILFHNFLSTNKTSYIHKVGKKEMKRSRTGGTTIDKTNKGSSSGQTSIIRTSKQGWIYEKAYRFPVTETYLGWDNQGLFYTCTDITNKTSPEYPANVQDHLIITDLSMYRLTKRIELATKLVLDKPYASEAYQVVNYGIAGQYDIHPDVAGYHTYPGQSDHNSKKFKPWYSLVGGRQSTFMAYLSLVESGGGTAFPLLGIKFNPIVGDAIFWNNILSDGKADYLSVHGGCPIVVGSKWVTNKWIMNYDNFRESPCNLDEYQPINTVTLWRKSRR